MALILRVDPIEDLYRASVWLARLTAARAALAKRRFVNCSGDVPIAVLPSLDRGDTVADTISKVIHGCSAACPLFRLTHHQIEDEICRRRRILRAAFPQWQKWRKVRLPDLRTTLRIAFLRELLSVRLQGLQERLLILHVWKTNS
jgi:hypothetical protein